MDDIVSILVVCGANQARSPLATELLRRSADVHLGPANPVVVTSAGLIVTEYAPAIDNMQTAARDLGIDLSTHEAHRIDAALVRGSDLIVTMTEAQRTTVSRMQPQALTRVFTLRELVRLCSAISSPPAPLAAKVRALHRSRAVVAAADDLEDVTDPGGLDLAATSAIAQEIAALTATASDYLFGAPSDEREPLSAETSA